jgi:hypothetical protein
VIVVVTASSMEVAGLMRVKRSIQQLIWRLQWTPDRAGTLWLLAATIIAIAIFATVMIYYPFAQQQNAGAGFGPEWDCTPQAKGGPTCIKKIGR